MSASIQRQGLTLQMVSHQKCKLAASSERNNYILKFSFHFHEIQFRTKSCTFLKHLNGRSDTLFVLLFRTFTGKSLSEALILASTNPQYDDRLFIELKVQYHYVPEWKFWLGFCIGIQNNLSSEFVFFMY